MMPVRIITELTISVIEWQLVVNPHQGCPASKYKHALISDARPRSAWKRGSPFTGMASIHLAIGMSRQHMWPWRI